MYMYVPLSLRSLKETLFDLLCCGVAARGRGVGFGGVGSHSKLLCSMHTDHSWGKQVCIQCVVLETSQYSALLGFTVHLL